MTLKILSDFDGVWTDPQHEADSVRQLMMSEVARLTGVELARVVEDFEGYLALAMAKPAEFGWAPPAHTGGRVTAFVDEDPFCQGNAIASVIGLIADGAIGSGRAELDQRACEYGAAVLARGFGKAFQSTSDFADHAFLEAASAYREAVDHALVDNAVEIAQSIFDAGCELVVVSNSSTDKLMSWFQAVGIPCHVAGETPTTSGPSAAVRGAAGKFIIGASDASLDVGPRHVYVDRPKYLNVIEAENPDLIIGDVFSLDLALPATMRAAGHTAAPDHLVLRRHDYSPTWSAEHKAGGHIDHVIDQLDELPILIHELIQKAHA